ncbi:MAG: hypothetical protein H0W02_07060 [Ktedonobacteraceae bacterium]|nr:hypothetical protein [Ktedonobacteraceae bacterium]
MTLEQAGRKKGAAQEQQRQQRCQRAAFTSSSVLATRANLVRNLLMRMQTEHSYLTELSYLNGRIY